MFYRLIPNSMAWKLGSTRCCLRAGTLFSIPFFTASREAKPQSP